jgi:hypothetical protein
MSSKNITISLTKSEAKALCRIVQFWTNSVSPVEKGIKFEKWIKQDLANIKSATEKIATVYPEAAS